MVINLDLPPNDTAPRMARDVLRSRQLAVDPETRHRAAIVCTEFIAAWLKQPHPPDHIALSVETVPRGVKLYVYADVDEGPHPVALPSPLGRRLIRRCSARWGVSGQPGRPCLWAEV